ncbi:MAG: hypothetical protein M3R43_12615, partial [Acidobacteriota bacterium]|nr:hypothetical protein [Acidobacteriota bacterium]
MQVSPLRPQKARTSVEMTMLWLCEMTMLWLCEMAFGGVSLSTVRVEDDGVVRTITLNRPERRNALTPEVMEELVAAFSDANSCGAR